MTMFHRILASSSILLFSLASFAQQTITDTVSPVLYGPLLIAQPSPFWRSGSQIGSSVQVTVGFCAEANPPTLSIASIQEGPAQVYPDLGGAIAVVKSYVVNLKTLRTRTVGVGQAAACYPRQVSLQLPCQQNLQVGNFKLQNPSQIPLSSVSAISCDYQLAGNGDARYLNIEAFASGYGSSFNLEPTDFFNKTQGQTFDYVPDFSSGPSLQQPQVPSYPQEGNFYCSGFDKFGDKLSISVSLWNGNIDPSSLLFSLNDNPVQGFATHPSTKRFTYDATMNTASGFDAKLLEFSLEPMKASVYSKRTGSKLELNCMSAEGD